MTDLEKVLLALVEGEYEYIAVGERGTVLKTIEILGPYIALAADNMLSKAYFNGFGGKGSKKLIAELKSGLKTAETEKPESH